MPAKFAGFEDMLSAAVDHVFGERFLFLPMTQPTVNSRLGVDGARPSFECEAVIDDRNPGASGFERLGKTSGGSATSSNAPQFSTSNPMLFFEGAPFGASPPRRLDRFKRLGTGDVYEITTLEKDGQGRLKAGLVRVAKEAS